MPNFPIPYVVLPSLLSSKGLILVTCCVRGSVKCGEAVSDTALLIYLRAAALLFILDGIQFGVSRGSLLVNERSGFIGPDRVSLLTNLFFQYARFLVIYN